MTIKQFTEAHGISPAMYFKIKAQGLGPREMKIGRRALITHEDAAKWRAERVAATNAEPAEKAKPAKKRAANDARAR
jgi:hypothetical protein